MHIIAKNIEENVNASFIKSEISTETFKKMPCNSKSFSKITICFNRLRNYMYPFFEKHHLVKNNIEKSASRKFRKCMISKHLKTNRWLREKETYLIKYVS